MLVISRKKGERILFPELGIEVIVVRINGNRVQLSLAASPEISIRRAELVEGTPEFDLRNRRVTARYATTGDNLPISYDQTDATA